MSSNLDRALEAIDQGLQRSSEGGLPGGPGDRCWRCRRHPGEGSSELCGGCRAFLLEEGPDPLEAPAELEGLVRPVDVAELAWAMAVSPELAGAILERLVEVLRPAVEAMADAVEGLLEALSSAGSNLVGILDPRARRLEDVRVNEHPAAWQAPPLAHRIPLPDLSKTAIPRSRPTPPRRTP